MVPGRTHRGRRYARFSPLSPADLALFRAAMAGEPAIGGLRNADITERLLGDHPPTATRPGGAANGSPGSSSSWYESASVMWIGCVLGL